MKIDDWKKSPYKDSSIIKNCEKSTFAFLSSAPRIREKFPELYRDAKLQYDAMSSPEKAEVHNIDFQSFFEVNCLGRDLRIYIGSTIKNDYSHVSYYLAICTKNKRGRHVIRRKFHFDYEKNDTKNTKPKFHLQYGGEMPSALKEHEKNYDLLLFPKLSEPRIYSTPVTLAILLNKLFREFYCVDTHNIVEDPRWRGVIAEHEGIFLRPYFERCGEFFRRNHQASYLFTTDFCYGK